MLLTSTFAEPILVAHPRTNALIDIAPLFDAMEQLDGETNSPLDAVHALDRVIEMVALTVHDPQVSSALAVSLINFDLYRLREMFRAMQVSDGPATA